MTLQKKTETKGGAFALANEGDIANFLVRILRQKTDEGHQQLAQNIEDMKSTQQLIEDAQAAENN